MVMIAKEVVYAIKFSVHSTFSNAYSCCFDAEYGIYDLISQPNKHEDQKGCVPVLYL